MKHRRLIVATLTATAALALVVGRFAVAEPNKDAKPAAAAAGAQPAMKLPPGWTEQDMQKCMAATVPGKMHEQLLRGVGAWQGKQTMWMYPGADPVVCDVTANVTAIMDGRYVKTEITGDVPGMGPFTGSGINGFDNVSQQFVATWIDNWTTGILTATGKQSADGNTMTWNYTFNCPLTSKPQIIRQIETFSGSDKWTLESHTTDPKSGKEYKMMTLEFTKKS